MNIERPRAEIVFRGCGESRSEWVEEYEGPFRNYITRASVGYRLVGWQIVSSGGEQTHVRLIYEGSPRSFRAPVPGRRCADARRAPRVWPAFKPRSA